MNSQANQNFWGASKMTRGIVHVHARYSLPKWPVVKLTFFAPLCDQQIYRQLTIPVSTTNGSCGKQHIMQNEDLINGFHKTKGLDINAPNLTKTW